MSGLYDQARTGLKRWMRAHPTVADWVALRDRQLNSKRTRELEAHLETCETCKIETQGLEETFALFLKANVADKLQQTPPNEGLMMLQEQIQVWRRAQKAGTHPAIQQSMDTRERWQSVSAELAIYLGPQMTARLIEAANQSSQEVRDILAIVRPVLTGLLGEKAAFNVTTQLFKIFVPERSLA